jgi:GNAT superfamily N-acetyltransferase
MSPRIEVIRACSEHLLQAQILINEYYEALNIVKRDTPEEIAIFLTEDSGSATWIAFAENEEGKQVPAGVVVLRPLEAESHPTLRDIKPVQGDKPLLKECKRLYVRDKYRGLRIAHQLLDPMEAYAKEKGTKYIYLDSKDDLESALALYKKRGYTACERYNTNPQATIFLRKEL